MLRPSANPKPIWCRSVLFDCIPQSAHSCDVTVSYLLCPTCALFAAEQIVCGREIRRGVASSPLFSRNGLTLVEKREAFCDLSVTKELEKLTIKATLYFETTSGTLTRLLGEPGQRMRMQNEGFSKEGS